MPKPLESMDLFPYYKFSMNIFNTPHVTPVGLEWKWLKGDLWTKAFELKFKTIHLLLELFNIPKWEVWSLVHLKIKIKLEAALDFCK